MTVERAAGSHGDVPFQPGGMSAGCCCCAEICPSCCPPSCTEGDIEICCDDETCVDGGAGEEVCDECCGDEGCALQLQPCDGVDCRADEDHRFHPLHQRGSLLSITPPTFSHQTGLCVDCDGWNAWHPVDTPGNSSGDSTSVPITPDGTWHDQQQQQQQPPPLLLDPYGHGGFCRQHDCGVQHYDGSIPGFEAAERHFACETDVGSKLAQLRDQSPDFSVVPDDGGHVGTSSLDPHHCHWNSCDLSFLDSLEFDQHFLNDHLLPLNNRQGRLDQNDPSSAVAIGADVSNGGSSSTRALDTLVCAWDACATRPKSVPALFDHVKHDHLLVEEHHRCKWLVAAPDGNVSPCNLCVKSVEDLTRHIAEVHIGTRQTQYTCYWQDCDRCTRPFSQRQKIIRHIVVHTGDRPHKCDICGYQCSEESVLRQHRRIHTGEKPFKCTVCTKSFSASTALSVHMRTHTGFKPLTCRFPGCGKRFSESSNLAKHMRTHSEDRPFACDFPGCGKSFQRSDQLKRHRKCVHKICPSLPGDDMLSLDTPMSSAQSPLEA